MRPINRIVSVSAVLSFLALGAPLAAQGTKDIGDNSDGNRAQPVHLLKLYDERGVNIQPGDSPIVPFSTRETCRQCHNYGKISSGWHFNPASDSIPPGRPGEPWIYVNRAAVTQLPLSYRRWAGTYVPEQIGMTAFKFTSTFGRQAAGGGVSEDERFEDVNDALRWQISGKLDVNCLSCHDAEPGHNQAEYSQAVTRQNFRWAATASSGFASMRGAARDMPDNFDMYGLALPEKADAVRPMLSYNRNRFDERDRVLFDVERRVPAGRCYFCHSTKVIDPAVPERWESDEDVHLRAGMTCVDCHRNGLDHQMVRGYEGEKGPASAATLSCKGCHMENGRMGAPKPLHVGIPAVHFDKLTCTACHSGPWPDKTTLRVKTARAHSLGIPNADKTDDALPQIMEPVFASQADGKIAPHRAVWPSFWARMAGDSLRLIQPELVGPFVSDLIIKDTSRVIGRWLTLTDRDVAKVLVFLRHQDSTAGTPVFISGGKLHQLVSDTTIERHDHKAAEPYLWPYAHDVRSKARSLGVRGCGDCHDTDASLFFGKVAVATPFVAQSDTLVRMTRYQEGNVVSAWTFAMSFFFRPWLKAIIITSFLTIAAVVVLAAFQGLSRLIRALSAGEE
jgi:hypothetical protein